MNGINIQLLQEALDSQNELIRRSLAILGAVETKVKTLEDKVARLLEEKKTKDTK